MLSAAPFSPVRVSDMMSSEGKIFLKSEWAPISDYWPCVSFSKASVGDRLRAEFKPGRDVLVYVGTTSAETTEDPEHRSRLLSAVVIEPNQMIPTRKIVPPQVWRQATDRWGERWPHSFAVIQAASIVGPPFPEARQVAPQAYRSFSEMANRGGVVLASGDEREAIMALSVAPVLLTLGEDVQQFLEIRTSVSSSLLDKPIRQAITAMIGGIQGRVALSEGLTLRTHPYRDAPDTGTLFAVLSRMWKAAEGRCAVCGGLLRTDGSNPMLQASPDRIDSSIRSYREDNLQIAHLACNLAKNRYGAGHLAEWLDVVRHEDEHVQS